MSNEWEIENLRVTLVSAKQKKRVIIQNNGEELRVTTKEAEESIRQEVGGKAATDKPAAADRKAKKDEPAEAPAAAQPAASAPAAATPTPSPAPASANGSLKWQPTEDTGYSGFAAESRDGKFVALKTPKSMWALYFSWGRGVHVGLGCFWEFGDAKVAAQKQHDEGPLQRPNGNISADMINKACPAPETAPAPPAAPPEPEAAAAPTTVPSGDAPRRPPRRPRPKKAAKEAEPAKAPEAPKPEAEAPETGDIEVDPEEAKKMLGQLKGLLDQGD